MKSVLYTEHQSEIDRQLIANNLTMAYSIDEAVLEKFENGEPIDRLTCTTYAEWLLQFLAWRTNFTFEETWRVASQSGGYMFVLRHLERELKPRDPILYRRVIDAACSSFGLSL